MASNAATLEQSVDRQAHAAVLAGEITGVVDAEQALTLQAGIYADLDMPNRLEAAHKDLSEQTAYLHPEATSVLNIAYTGLLAAHRQ